MSSPRLRSALASTTRYAPARHAAPCDLDLAGTELPPLDPVGLAADRSTAPTTGYPDASALQHDLAQRLGLGDDRLLVSAGSDDALERACRVMLEPGRTAILTAPTFEMLPRWVHLTGAACRELPWPREPFPVDAVLDAIDATTALVAIVSPNNPTGAVVNVADISAIARMAPDALVLVDLAYVEFAEDDPTSALLAWPNVVITRTLSKAWGLAALRVGYAAGPVEIIAAMQRVAPPYPVSASSVTAVRAALARDAGAVQERVALIRGVRDQLSHALATHAMRPIASQANFVATAAPRAPWLRDGLAGLGIATRGLDGASGPITRIATPITVRDTTRLLRAIGTVLDPEALLFDMDGVLANVGASYRAAILSTAERFGVRVTADDVRARKAAGSANDDWALTHELVTQRGVDVTLAEVTAVFESAYQGDDRSPGLCLRESLIPSVALIRELAARLPLGIVTGRPRADALRFLEVHGLRDLFRVVVCREDAALKPDPAPVKLALQQLDVTRAWMVGDTPDDIRAARAAGVVPLGVLAPGDPDTASMPLRAAGAARVLHSLEGLLPCLP